MASIIYLIVAAVIVSTCPYSVAFSSSPTQNLRITPLSVHHSTSTSAKSCQQRRQSRTISPSTITRRRQFTSLYASTANVAPAPTAQDECDVLVLGSGPAARAIATLLASSTDSNNSSNSPYDILLADSNYDRPWIPNYGVWQDEWQSIRDLYASIHSVPIG